MNASPRLTLARVITVASAALALTALAQASGSEPGAFPPAGSCHPRGHGLFVLPDARCTPGATNPAVTQATIGATICTPGWSESVRPPESVTEPQKRLAIAAYGYYDGQSLGVYEFDHLISISLGGALDSPKNLWPEPDYPGVAGSSFYLNPKDKLEDKLHVLVCEKRMLLVTAQKLLGSDWIAGYRKWIGPVTPTRPPTKPRDSRSYRTNASGYADVYLSVHANPARQSRPERSRVRVTPAPALDGGPNRQPMSRPGTREAGRGSSRVRRGALRRRRATSGRPRRCAGARGCPNGTSSYPQFRDDDST